MLKLQDIFPALALIYKNFFYKRNKIALYGIIAFGFFYTFYAYFKIRSLIVAFAVPESFGLVTTLLAVSFTAFAWFVFLPATIYFIDYKNNKKRFLELL